MRFMITAAPDPQKSATESAADGALDDKIFADYMRFNEEMAKAGVLIVAEGLNPQGKGARVGIVNGKRAILDGPFTESKELVGGFYLIEVASREEAIEWALRAPVGLGLDEVLTIHQMTEAADIPPRYVDIINEVAPTWSASFTKTRA